MKRFIILTVVTFLSCNISFGQNGEKEKQTYAIVQVLTPQTIFGDFKISIFYGNEKIEEYKNVKYNKDNKDKLSTNVVDVLNYMEKNGYKLESVLNFTITNIETQYVFKKTE